jgi:hypothetical protein
MEAFALQRQESLGRGEGPEPLQGMHTCICAMHAADLHIVRCRISSLICKRSLASQATSSEEGPHENFILGRQDSAIHDDQLTCSETTENFMHENMCYLCGSNYTYFAGETDMVLASPPISISW